MSVSVSPDNKFFATGGFDMKIRIYDLENKDLKYIYKEDESMICSLSFSSDG